MKALVCSSIRPHRRMIYLTAAAAISSTIPSSSAFTSPLLLQPPTSPASGNRNPYALQDHRPGTSRQTRLFFSNSNGGKDDSSLSSTVKKTMRSLNPKYWFMSKEEKEAKIRQEEYKDEIQTGIRQVLKDAPPLVRAVGGLVAPLLSSALGAVGDQWSAQQETMSRLLNDAQSMIVSDPTVSDLLGEPISVGSPFSQSSSTQSINGKVTSITEAKFPVQGRKDSGVAMMSADQNGINYLSVNVGGREIQVDVNPRRTASVGNSSPFGRENLGKNAINKDDIIDVEFVEKDTSNRKP